MAAKLLPFLTATPLAGAFFVCLLGRRFRSFPPLIGVLVPGALLGVSLFIWRAVLKTGPVYHFIGGWKPPYGIPMVCDGLSVFMLITVYGVASCIALYAVSYMQKYTALWKFYALFLLILTGLSGVLLSGDLFDLFVYLELTSLSACTLVAFGTERQELEAAFKYGVMNTIGGLFILFGIAFLYGYASTLNMADLAGVLAAKGAGNKVVPLVSVLFLVGFGLKAAIVPFHAWLPDAHPSAPAPISAMLSGLIIKCSGIYALFRIFCCVLGPQPHVMSALLFLGALSIGVGSFLAIGQTDFKRLLAYSSLTQVGTIVLGISLGTPLGILGGLYHLFNHAVFKSLLFLNSGALEYATGTRDIEALGGMSKKMPTTTATNLIASMSISGIPPFNGFWSKLIIIIAAVQARRYGYAVVVVVGSLLTLASFAKVMRYAFQGSLKEKWSAVKEVPIPMQSAMVLLALVCVAGGLLLLPSLKAAFITPAVQVLLNGVAYAKVFGGILG
jgi:multicomponent Na+:H+ antiporter subunit D